MQCVGDRSKKNWSRMAEVEKQVSSAVDEQIQLKTIQEEGQLELANNVSEIVNEGEGRRPQQALSRTATLKKTRRKSLKRSSKRKSERVEEPPPLPPTTVKEVLEKMEEGRGSEETQLSCLSLLERLVEADTVDSGALIQYGAADRVFSALESYHGNCDLVATGLWVIANLARIENVCAIVIELGGVAHIVKAMMTHKTSVDVLHPGCAAICNMAITEQWRQHLSREGVVEVVVKAMKWCQSSEWVQFTAIQALQNLCNTVSLCRGVLDQGAIPPLLQTMETMSDHEELLQSACWMLSCIAFATDDDCRMKVGELGAIPRVVHALEASPDHRGVHFTGASALSNFARTEQLHSQMVESRCVPVLIKASSSFPSHQGIQAVSFRALVLLSKDENAKLQMQNSSLLSLCEQTLATTQEGPAVVEATQLQRLLLGEKTTKGCCCIM